ncbi:VanZ family protein [Lederbergia citrea]|uniref:VanZ family protein n=1 Tax=Lederbergia citrea TaxID=2833581 RepID=UPI003211BDCD
MKNILKVIMLLIVAGLIYAFSSQTYEQQSLVPMMWKVIPGEPFKGILSKLEINYWGQVISVETKGYYYFLEFLIRKFAHMFLFGCLAVALFSVIMLAKPKRVWPVVWISLIATGLYASFDELHQLYTGGRTPLVADVFLDLTGAAIALLIFVPIYMIRRKFGR